VNRFLAILGRGNRDTIPRRSDPSIQQVSAMMNDNFVLSRISGVIPPIPAIPSSRLARLLPDHDDPEFIIKELYMHTLSREPSRIEIEFLKPQFEQLGNRTAGENLQWSLLNHLEFLFVN
jgi:hypothetical protein